jgi:16S rRNA G966 N2-methylase RsmD
MSAQIGVLLPFCLRETRQVAKIVSPSRTGEIALTGRGSLPKANRLRRMQVPNGGFKKLTHYLFRYPAKFHPPIARTLIEQFSVLGETVLDPFCGSGTIAVEARVLGRNVIVADIDPVAVFVARAKARTPVMKLLRRDAAILLERLSEIQRSDSEYDRRMFADIKDASFRAAVRHHDLDIPKIPNIEHWFRRYVIIDLARILELIKTGTFRPINRDIFLLCFASVIRNASNADPVPVSGLEVTAHMKRRDLAGRMVNPFALYRRALGHALESYDQFTAQVSQFSTSAKALRADATELDRDLKSSKVDTVITSPPYHNAVDYYRRHTLEMYWLGLVHDHNDRLRLLPHYIGRSRVPNTHPAVRATLNGCKTAARWEAILRAANPERADAFKHYLVSMRNCVTAIARLLPRGKPLVLVVGKSTWNSAHIPTVELFKELGQDRYFVRESFWYPIKNRYMSYSRHNGASIDREYVLVLERQ